MKTLHIDTGREMRGGQWQVIYLLERLEGATLLAREDAPLFLEARARGIDVQPVVLKKITKKFDLVHAHDARAHTMAAVVPGIRLVVARRVAFPVNSGFLSKLKYARADLFLAVSRYVAAQLRQAGIDDAKIRIVYDGVPLAEQACGDWIVALASKDGELIRRAAEIARVEVRFATKLWDDLSKAKMFLYASGMEGLGSAALAAMSASLPVIASNVGGLCEAVAHERTGLLVPNRPEDFASSIQRLLRDPERAAEMGRLGRERVEAQFTIDHMVKNTLAAYEEVLR
ncbi:MAG: glycosyltransferase family 4 protein [Acidobacteriia bacterium]|nr:glycosyltransferase family 4 protein [Terriglobia bacterium]